MSAREKSSFQISKSNLETFVPLYISNYCDGVCRICNLRKSNSDIHRIQGERSDIVEQLSIIKDVEGISALCFLTGEFNWNSARRKQNFELVLWCIEKAYSVGFEKIYFNIGALTNQEIAEFYQRFSHKTNHLVLSIFQETYDQNIYRKTFGDKQNIAAKGDFGFRYTTPMRWIESGFRCVDIGILLGLSCPDRDTEMLVQHAHELLSFEADVSISLPRIIAEKAAPFEISDQLFKDIVSSVSRMCVNAKIIVTTRESTRMIMELMPHLDIVSPGCSDVLPYTREGILLNRSSTSQFQVNPIRTRPSSVLKTLGVESIEYFNQGVRDE